MALPERSSGMLVDGHIEAAAGRPAACSDTDAPWQALLAAAAQTREREVPREARSAAIGCPERWPPIVEGSTSDAPLVWAGGGWRCAPGILTGERDFLELYLPLCQPLTGGVRIVGHLGQSLDGCIATRTGDSRFVTGQDNLRHLHRMRALCDAVIVGAGTVAHDDPRLTTRLVPGTHPVRVVLDPERRLGRHYRVFADDEAPTLLCCNAEHKGPATVGQAEVMGLPARAGALNLRALATALAERGLRRLFVEGGGVTVSGFLRVGLLERLHIAVAPLIIGRGRTGVTLPPCDALRQALRPPCRVYRMGQDMLYDLDLSTGRALGREQGATEDPATPAGLSRVC
jgi:diaminohydroxyphosphoribosylaminopyrimidine deaminase / 5-amino-6-(5-phosphoribosylamino)uracil reductase